MSPEKHVSRCINLDVLQEVQSQLDLGESIADMQKTEPQIEYSF